MTIRTLLKGADVKEIPLTRGEVALVDDEDYDFLMQWKWQCWTSKHRRVKYAFCTGCWDGYCGSLRMHVVLMNPPEGMQVDHIDRNGLNNQRSNLRLASPRQNMWNRGKNRNNTSGYTGVTRNKGSWVAQITINGKCVNLGRFADPVTAAHAYDEAARRHRGKFAVLNFPDNS